MSRHTRWTAFVLLGVGLLLGCKKENHSGHDHGPGGHDHAEGSAQCEHKIAESICPFCNPKLIETMGMCGGHGVPEALCTRCNEDLIPAFKARKDWCEEHGLPESQCEICNPDLKKAPGGASAGEAHEDSVKLAPEAVVPSGIRVEPAAAHVLRPTLRVPARVSFNPEAMAHVGSPLRGRAVEVQAKLGDKVNKGDVLLLVDSPEMGEAQLDLFQKRVAQVAAQPHVELAQSAHDRAKKLYDENRGISLSELQKREGELKTAQGTLASAKAAVTSAANHLLLLGMDAQTIDELAHGQQVRPSLAIRAPIAGQVVQREVTLGELVGPDREALLVLADVSKLWVLAEVPETRLSEIAIDAPAHIALASLGDRLFAGKVVYIAASLNPVTRTATVRLEVADDQQALRPGMFAQAEITLGPPGQATPVLAVPEQAVQNIEGKPCVFVASKEPHTFIKRPVKVGPTVGRMVPVLDGLKEGEPVVVSGSFILKADLGKSGAAHEH